MINPHTSKMIKTLRVILDTRKPRPSHRVYKVLEHAERLAQRTGIVDPARAIGACEAIAIILDLEECGW